VLSYEILHRWRSSRGGADGAAIGMNRLAEGARGCNRDPARFMRAQVTNQ
jgi:hypothetical protein